MKRNHAVKVVFGIIFLIFAIITLALAGYLFATAQGWLPIPELPKIPVPDGEGGYIEQPIADISSLYTPETLIGTAAIGGVFLLLAIIFFSMSGKKYMAKINDVYGLPKQGYYRLAAFKPFLIIGGILSGIVTMGGGFFLNDPQYQKYVFIAMGVSYGILFLGLLMLIPLPMSMLIKRQYKGNRVTITIPASRALSGKFMPNQVINELQAAYNMGYDILESFEPIGIKEGKGQGERIRFTMRSSDLDEKQLKKNRKAVQKQNKKGFPEWYEKEPVFEYRISEELGDEYSETRALHTLVNDYDTITTYSDGTKTRSSHYSSVVTGSETTFKRDKYYIYDFFMIDDEDILRDEDDNPFFIIVLGKAIVTGYKTTGSGY